MSSHHRQAVDLLEDAADRIAAAAGNLLWSRRDADHTDLYRAGSALTRITGAMQEITGHLTDAAENYAARPDLRDDAGSDPADRIMAAVTYLLQAATAYRSAGVAATAYQAAIGHIATETGPA